MLDNNQFTGTIRDAFNNFPFLEFVDVSQNQISGTLPQTIFDISTVSVLYFHENRMTGSIPTNFGNPPLLRDFYVNNNKLTGFVPSIQPDQLTVLGQFRLERNHIVGTMPASICALRGSHNASDLVTLTSDCAGNPPEIQCDCCTACFFVIP